MTIVVIILVVAICIGLFLYKKSNTNVPNINPTPNPVPNPNPTPNPLPNYVYEYNVIDGTYTDKGGACNNSVYTLTLFSDVLIESNVTALYTDNTLTNKYVPFDPGYIHFKKAIGGSENGSVGIIGIKGNIGEVTLC